MCKFISFFHNPATGDIKIYDLNNHENTKQHHNLNENIWCEGHYLPDETIDARVWDKVRETKEECTDRIKTRFPTFIDFLNWCFEQEIDYSSWLDLSSLKSAEGLTLLTTISGGLILNNKVRAELEIKQLNRRQGRK